MVVLSRPDDIMYTQTQFIQCFLSALGGAERTVQDDVFYWFGSFAVVSGMGDAVELERGRHSFSLLSFRFKIRQDD